MQPPAKLLDRTVNCSPATPWRELELAPTHVGVAFQPLHLQDRLRIENGQCPPSRHVRHRVLNGRQLPSLQKTRQEQYAGAGARQASLQGRHDGIATRHAHVHMGNI